MVSLFLWNSVNTEKEIEGWKVCHSSKDQPQVQSSKSQLDAKILEL